VQAITNFNQSIKFLTKDDVLNRYFIVEVFTFNRDYWWHVSGIHELAEENTYQSLEASLKKKVKIMF
jgi:hypothetical protein